MQAWIDPGGEEPLPQNKSADPDLKIVLSKPFNLAECVERTDAQVLVVSSAASVRACKRLLTGVVALTWLTVDVHQTDWSLLANRDRKHAILWPDNDAESVSEMTHVGVFLQRMGYKVEIAECGPGKVNGWNLASADQVDEWTGPIIRQWVKENKRDFGSQESSEGDGSEPTYEEELLQIAKQSNRDIDAQHDEAYLAFWNATEWSNAHWIDLGLVMSGGRPLANVSNVSLVLDKIVTDKIWYDSFLRQIITEGPDGHRPWTDPDDIRMTIEIQRRCGVVKAGKDLIAQAVIEFSMRNVRNCLHDYLMGLKWDKKPRIKTAFVHMFGVESTSYFWDVSSNFFKSMVSRAIWPGIKCDTMLVLEGPQGIGKSTCLEILAGEWYMVMNESPDSHDFAIAMAGKWLCEVAEMHAFSRADVRSTKRTLSTACDTYRSPYAIHAKTHPRQSILAGTTNRDDWMGDETGGRRFWPVLCNGVNLEWTKNNRDQLFAEAVALVTGRNSKPEDKKFWEFEDQKEEKEQQMRRFAHDIWNDRISNWLNVSTEANDCLAISTVMEKALGLSSDQMDRKKELRVGNVMRMNGWESYPRRVGRQVLNRWRKVKTEYEPVDKPVSGNE